MDEHSVVVYKHTYAQIKQPELSGCNKREDAERACFTIAGVASVVCVCNTHTHA